MVRHHNTTAPEAPMVTTAVRTDLIIQRSEGRAIELELIDGPDRIDTCDCHHFVWPAATLTYRPGPDTFECPLSPEN